MELLDADGEYEVDFIVNPNVQSTFVNGSKATLSTLTLVDAKHEVSEVETSVFHLEA